MSELELLSCPFCGESHAVICKTEYQGDFVYCVSCRMPQCHGGIFELAMGEFPTREAATQAWNTRAPDMMILLRQYREALERLSTFEPFIEPYKPKDIEEHAEVMCRVAFARKALTQPEDK